MSSNSTPALDIHQRVAERDAKNLAVIAAARQSGRINDDAARQLSILYSDGMSRLREVFVFLGKCFGAPKAPVARYDYDADCADASSVTIAEINPLEPYLVQHRLDADYMKNQFFTSTHGHKINLAVSSIVTIIVGAQKKIDRSLDKVTGKYYDKYVQDVACAVRRVIAARAPDASACAIADKIRDKLSEKYISEASAAVLSIIGRGHEGIAVELVRELDKIARPCMRLQDVWRVKCLFDLIPQARQFIERVHQIMPDRVLSVRDDFYNIENPRNYRDAKLIINIGTDDEIVPMEIICQVRTLLSYERKTHDGYEITRRSPSKNNANIERELAATMEQGIREYNTMVCKCLDDLFERVGWNILYNNCGTAESLFEGFPPPLRLHYPQKIHDIIIDKLDSAIENEVFTVENAPAKLTQAQTSQIFHYMAHFVLAAAMPYMYSDWSVPSDTMAGKLFNFVMGEVSRHYKK